jgi:hypothetical protein
LNHRLLGNLQLNVGESTFFTEVLDVERLAKQLQRVITEQR